MDNVEKMDKFLEKYAAGSRGTGQGHPRRWLQHRSVLEGDLPRPLVGRASEW